MQLHRLWINGYKNLIETTIDFDGCGIPIAIIGNNGTGKSNLIEALLEIFMGLYYDSLPDFEYEISYTAHRKNVSIKKGNNEPALSIHVDDVLWSRSRFKKRIRETDNMPPFPALVFGYYSGTCDRVEKLLKRYERSFSLKMRKQSEQLQRNFIFSNIEQAELILISLIAHGHSDFLNKLNIKGATNLKITFEPPSSYDPLSADITLWNTEGAIREFLAALDNYSSDSYDQRVEVDEQYITSWRRYSFLSEYDEGNEKLRALGEALENRGTNLYSMLLACRANKMLLKLEFDVETACARHTHSFDALSEGEKQLISVIGGLTMAHHQECLVLLDEPDTHLNPKWSWEYDHLLKQALQSEQLSTSTVLLATHDPVIISGLLKEQVLIAHNQNCLLSYTRPHRDPRGQGVANVLTSEYFGLPSSLDKYSQSLLDKRLELAYKTERLTEIERTRLTEINIELEYLGLSISFRDPAYAKFEETRERGQ